MSEITPYRVAAILLALVFIGHTVGTVLTEPIVGPDGDAVLASMKTVSFNFFGSTRTWYGFYYAFCIVESLFLGFSAFLSWQLDSVPDRSWPYLAPIAWALAGVNTAQAVLSWMYFFIVPSVLTTAATTLLVIGTWQNDRRHRDCVEPKRED